MSAFKSHLVCGIGGAGTFLVVARRAAAVTASTRIWDAVLVIALVLDLELGHVDPGGAPAVPVDHHEPLGGETLHLAVHPEALVEDVDHRSGFRMKTVR